MNRKCKYEKCSYHDTTATSYCCQGCAFDAYEDFRLGGGIIMLVLDALTSQPDISFSVLARIGKHLKLEGELVKEEGDGQYRVVGDYNVSLDIDMSGTSGRIVTDLTIKDDDITLYIQDK